MQIQIDDHDKYSEQIPRVDKKTYILMHNAYQTIYTVNPNVSKHRQLPNPNSPKRKSTLRDRTKQDDTNIVIIVNNFGNRTEATHHPDSNQNELTHSILGKLGNTFNVNDTLSSTITATCLDETYEEPLDDSIAKL